MGEPSIDTLHDTYEEQLSAARFKAERDAARQEADKSLMDAMTWEMEAEGMADELVRMEVENKRLGHLVWRLQNRLARAHRREKALRKGMRMWREKAISGPVRTVSAYDLLPEDDLQALRWVREQGGLEALKAYTDCFSNLLRECHGYRDLAREYEKRIMPEGCKWPRYKGGRPVRFGDAGLDVHGKRRMVGGVKFTQGGFAFISDDRGRTWWANDRGPLEEPEIDPDKCVKRPAAIAADGELLEVGQTVWVAENGNRFHVVRLCDDGLVQGTLNGDLMKYLKPEQLTHQRPVLDADGVPVKVGDTVWLIGGGEPAEVAYTIEADASHPDEVVLKGYEDDWPVNADKLTHAKPEQDSHKKETCENCIYFALDPDTGHQGVCFASFTPPSKGMTGVYGYTYSHSAVCRKFEEGGE